MNARLAALADALESAAVVSEVENDDDELAGQIREAAAILRALAEQEPYAWVSSRLVRCDGKPQRQRLLHHTQQEALDWIADSPPEWDSRVEPLYIFPKAAE